MKTVRAIPSKSDAHRALIAAALSETPCRVDIRETSNDIEATKACLAEITRFVRERDSGGASAAPRPAVLRCGESGSTLRFLLPVTGALGVCGAFYPEGRLPSRPLHPLDEQLRAHGMDIAPAGTVPFAISGKLTAGTYTIPGNISSQFVSGLLFALPLLDGASRIVVTGALASSGYVAMTLRTIRAFGIRVEESAGQEERIYWVPGRQKYQGPVSYEVEGDWSNAAFFLAAGAIGRDSVTVTGLSADSAQSDRRIVDILREFGADVRTETGEDGLAVTAEPSRGLLHGITIDAEQIPDMVPSLALIASVAEGTTEIVHAERLRGKESDRLEAASAELSKLGAEVRERPDGLVITGKPELQGGAAESRNDHRIAMMLAAASLACREPVRLTGWKAVRKSQPRFFDRLDELGLSGNLIRENDPDQE